MHFLAAFTMSTQRYDTKIHTKVNSLTCNCLAANVISYVLASEYVETRLTTTKFKQLNIFQAFVIRKQIIQSSEDSVKSMSTMSTSIILLSHLAFWLLIVVG